MSPLNDISPPNSSQTPGPPQTPPRKTVLRGARRSAMTSVWTAQILITGSSSLLILLPRMLDRQGMDLAWRGIVMATFSVAYLLGSLTGGQGIRALGYRRSAMIGVACAVAGCLAYIAADHWMPAYFLARFLHGFGCAWAILAFQGRLLAATHAASRGLMVGLTNLPSFLTLAFSPAIAEGVSRLGAHSGIFLLAALMCLLLFPFARPLPRRLPRRDPAPSRDCPTAAGSDAMRWTEWCLVALVVLFSAGLSFMRTLLPLTTSSLGWSFSAFFLAYGTSAFAVRAVADVRWNVPLPHAAKAAGAFLVPAASMALAAVNATAAFVLLGVLVGVGHGLFYPSLVQLIMRHTARPNVVSRLGKLVALQILGNIVGESGAGVVARLLGVRPALFAGGLAVLACQIVLLAAAVLGERSPTERSPAALIEETNR